MPDEKKNSLLVSVMAANNETGVIQPLRDIGILCRRHKVAFHSDMVQALGKYTISPEDYGIDYLTLSGHKIGAPTGIGAVWCRSGRPLHSLLAGGGKNRDAGQAQKIVWNLWFCSCGAICTARASKYAAVADEAEPMIIQHCPQIEIIGANVAASNTSCLLLVLPHKQLS